MLRFFINSFQASNYFHHYCHHKSHPWTTHLPERAGKTQWTESCRFEIVVSPCYFPTVRARKAIYTRRRESESESAREPMRCPSSRRIERKETPKKTGSFFPPRGSGAAPGPPVRGSLRERPSIGSWISPARRAGGSLTKINRRLA